MNKKIATEVALGIIMIVAIIIGGGIWLDSQKQEKLVPPMGIGPSGCAEEGGILIESGKCCAGLEPYVANRDCPGCTPICRKIGNQKDETVDFSDWQTYSSYQYKFEFEYPNNWSLKNDGSVDLPLYLTSPETEKNIDKIEEKPAADIIISRYTSVACMQPDCENKAESLLDTLQNNKNKGINGDVEAITVNGLKGYETVQYGTINRYTVYIEGAYDIFQIQFNFRGSKSDLTSEEKHVLFSFKSQKVNKVYHPVKTDTSGWTTYMNKKLGFKLKLPNMECCNKSIKHLEKGNLVWFFEEGGYDYNNNIDKFNGDGSEFEKASGIGWAILVKDAKNDDELEKFIQKRYGSTCKIGKKEYVAEKELYNVTIGNLGDLDDPSADCFVNYIVAIKYSTKEHKVAAWDIGQDYKLAGADEGVAESFEFLD